MDRNAIEGLFERNADMRLLELRHNEIGNLPAAARRAATFSAESVLATTYDDLAIDDAPRLRVALAAVPAAGVIPGAVVAVAIDIFNDGAAPAPPSTLVLALPHDGEYRAGSLRVDGREVPSGEQLFGSGLTLARLPGASSTKVTFGFVVLPGVTALHLQPQLQAGGVPVVGAPAVAVKRAVPGPGARTTRPFYELEEGETDTEVTPSAPPELPPVLPPAADAEPRVAAEPPRPAERPRAASPRAESPRAASAAKSTIAAPPRRPAPETPWPKISRPLAPPEPEPEPVPAVPVDELMPRYRTIAAADLNLLERLFAAPAPGMAAHGILIATLACSEDAAGADPTALGEFLRRDIDAAARALVLARMGKPAPEALRQADLDALAPAWEPAPERSPPVPGVFRLRRDLRRNEHGAVAGLFQPSDRDVTVRLRVALLALAGASVEGAAEPELLEAATAALASYRALALAWMVPLCVASGGGDAPPALGPPPAPVDDAGRRVVAILRDVVAR